MRKRSTVLFAVIALMILSAFTMHQLELKSFFNDKVNLKIPMHFEAMPEELIQLKYPSEQGSILAYTNEPGNINIVLNLTPDQANSSLISNYKEDLVKKFKTQYPSAKWRSNGFGAINGRQVGYLELISPTAESKIYQLVFFTHLEGKLLLCTFNCPEEEMEQWTTTAREIMNSLSIN